MNDVKKWNLPRGTTISESDAQRAIAELREEISDLHTTMMAAAVEIQDHWQAHCDEEGYGPANLMNRLERGIAAQYGYTAQTVVQIEAERNTLRQQLAERDAEILEQCRLNGMGAERELKLIAQRDRLAELLRQAMLKMAYMLKHGEWHSPEELIDRIDAALAEVKS